MLTMVHNGIKATTLVELVLMRKWPLIDELKLTSSQLETDPHHFHPLCCAGHQVLGGSPGHH